ncbi:hypothetical protein AB0M46_22485 [Dactylosporangium sp. NPDC051485]|uniref:hypothetical protein n=1 Tax=Dactylosporangium sp. NPDC051485 TaxID=3154846 RepID=UPI003436DCCA
MRGARWVLAIVAWTGCTAALSVFGLDRAAALRDTLLTSTRGDPGAGPTASPSPSPGSPVILRTPGGNVIAGCAGDQVRVQYLSPAAGFHIENADRAPGPESRVTFKTDGHEVRVVVHCAADGPHADITVG